jgi:hypothetical protein
MEQISSVCSAQCQGDFDVDADLLAILIDARGNTRTHGDRTHYNLVVVGRGWGGGVVTLTFVPYETLGENI